MKITLEDAEFWYRGDQDQNVSAHQVAVFYRGEFVRLQAETLRLRSKHEEVYHNYHEEGGGLIIPTGYGFALYQVPQYGGEPIFEAHFKTLDEAKKEADKWT